MAEENGHLGVARALDKPFAPLRAKGILLPRVTILIQLYWNRTIAVGIGCGEGLMNKNKSRINNSTLSTSYLVHFGNRAEIVLLTAKKQSWPLPAERLTHVAVLFEIFL